jgi:hypothetical protein
MLIFTLAISALVSAGLEIAQNYFVIMKIRALPPITLWFFRNFLRGGPLFQLFFIPTLACSAYIIFLLGSASERADLCGRIALIVAISDTISVAIASVFVGSVAVVFAFSPGMLNWTLPPFTVPLSVIFGILICVNLVVFVRGSFRRSTSEEPEEPQS